MREIFLYIVNMSITASILAAVVLLLRLLLKKAPKWISVLLWGLVALRLICPFAVESAFSLVPKTDWVVQEPLAEEDWFLNRVPDTIDPTDFSTLGEDITVHYYPIENPEIEIHRGISISFILSFVWVTGIAALLLHTLISTIRLRKSIGAAVRVRDNVWESSAVESPFVLGMIRPRIYVPRGMTVEKLTYVIAHEEAHIRRKDHWWKPLGFLLLTIHWFNPVLWLAYILLCRDIEMACDERVIKGYDSVQRADYSEALLTCSVNRKMISACPLAFGEVSVKERIQSVLNYKKPSFWIVTLAVVACIAVVVCFLTNPIDKPAISIDEHDWYFERVFITVLKDNTVIELYQPGLQPETENAVPVNAILVSGSEPMWYDLITGDWDTERFVNHFILEKADSKSAQYNVELYRDTGERYAGVNSKAVIKPIKNDDGYVLTIYEYSEGNEKEIIFTTKKQPGAVQGEKKLTLEDVLTLSEKHMALTWEDFAEYAYTDAGTWNFRCIYEIDDVFWLEITGGSMHGIPMQINLCTKADYGDGAEYIDIRRRYTDENIVAEFIDKHRSSSTPTVEADYEYTEIYYRDLAWDVAQTLAESAGITIDKNWFNLRHNYDRSTIWIQFYGKTESGWDDRYVDITIVRDGEGVYKVDPDGSIIGVNSENIKNTTRNVIANYVENIESVLDSSSSHSEIKETSSYVRLMNYDSEQILDYIFSEFLQGGKTDIHGFVLLQLMTDLLNDNEIISYDAVSGQDYFDHWLESARSVGEQHDAVWIEENMPAIALVLSMAEK